MHTHIDHRESLLLNRQRVLVLASTHNHDFERDTRKNGQKDRRPVPLPGNRTLDPTPRLVIYAPQLFGGALATELAGLCCWQRDSLNQVVHLVKGSMMNNRLTKVNSTMTSLTCLDRSKPRFLAEWLIRLSVAMTGGG